MNERLLDRSNPWNFFLATTTLYVMLSNDHQSLLDVKQHITGSDYHFLHEHDFLGRIAQRLKDLTLGCKVHQCIARPVS
jgi:hypothetical protein